MSQITSKFIKNNAVTNTQLAQMPAYTIKGNNGSGTANAVDLSVAQVTALLGLTNAPNSSILTWRESGTTVPNPVFEYGIATYGFSPKLGQTIAAVLQVPQTYTPGKQIKLYNRVYSADTSGTLLFQTVSTLIRSGIDAMSSTTNQRTSTNTALTLSSGTVNVPQAVIYDITDSSGNINSVAISVGDIIIISLTRSTTDTGASVARSLVLSSSLTFQ